MCIEMLETVHVACTSLSISLERRRRNFYLLRLRLHAFWIRTKLELRVADDAQIRSRARIQLAPRSRAKLVLGKGAIIDHDATIYLHSGEVHIGPGTHVRGNSVLSIRGRFEIGAESVISWGTVIHCGSAVTIGSKAGIAEHCTIADSVHFFTEPEKFFYHNTRHAPVVIGSNTWVASGVTITAGTTIGDHCILGSGAVVSRDVPDGHVVSAPRSEMRQGRLPWKAQEPKPPTTVPASEPDRLLTTGVPE